MSNFAPPPNGMSSVTPVNRLFTESTISKDDTQGADSRERQILASQDQVLPHQPQWATDTPSPRPPGKPPTDTMRLEAEHSMMEKLMKGDPSKAIDPDAEGLAPGNFLAEASSHDMDKSWRQELLAKRVDNGIAAVHGRGQEFGPSRSEGDQSPNCAAFVKKPKLALALGSIADEYLGLNVLGDDHQTSQYVAFLLDVINALQSRAQFQSHQKPTELNAGKTTSPKSTDNTKEKENLPRFKILHRVICGLSYHNHNGTIYEDVPVVNKSSHNLQLEFDFLSGKNEVNGVDSYLHEHPHIEFIVYKEYRCSPDPYARDSTHRVSREVSGETFKADRTLISPRHERLKIVSPLLQKALDRVAECKVDQVLFDDPYEDSWEMEAPYHFLFHHRQKLKIFMVKNPTYTPALSDLLEFVDQNYKKEYEEAESLFAKGEVTEAHVERLFKPNQMVITKTDGSYDAYVLDEWPLKKTEMLQFSGWRWRYDGRALERERWYGKMKWDAVDKRDIKSLSVCPVEHISEDIIAKLRDRGKKFSSLRNQQLVSYDGWDHHHQYLYSKEKFMVDMTTFTKMHTRPTYMFKAAEISAFDDWPVIIEQDGEMTDNQLLLLPPTTHGYSLREKKWISLHVDQTGPVQWNKKAFERLVLDKGTKDLLRALVDVRMSDSKKMDDLVAGKGNGLIMLLHGSPGTGKSLTAESVAEFAQKPLYRVTCGDIGTDAKKVEAYLDTIFYLGKIWDCVILLDEADVFLEERSVLDLKRNSLVSVFLRALEYYEGILILTFNRVGTFDEAFQSRIRVALHYEPLGPKFRKQIWINFFEMLEEDDDEIKVNIRGLEGRLDELAVYNMNGRQIRNVLLTARQLALHQQQSLEWSHLSQVLKLSEDFNQYLKDIRGGMGGEDWAKNQSLR